MSDTIKEFLIGLGFKLDEQGWSRFQSTVESATLKARIFGDAIEAVAKQVAGAVVKIADDFEGLFYASSRLGVSVESIRAFGYAVSQMGGTVAGAQSSLKAFGDWMRTTPGAENFLKNLGVATRDAQGHAIDRGQILLSIGQKLAAMSKQGPAGQAMASNYAGILGIDQDTLLAIERQGTQARYNESIAGSKSAGIGGPMAAAAARFEQAMRDTWNRITTFAEGAEGKLFGALAGPLEKLNAWLDQHKDEINSGLTKIATALSDVADKWVKGLGDMKPGEISHDFDQLATSLSDLVKWFAQLGDNLKAVSDYAEKTVKWLNFLSGVPGATNPMGPHLNADGSPEMLGDGSGGGGGGWWSSIKRFFGGGGGAETGGGGGKGRGEYTVQKTYDLLKKVGATDEEARILAAIAQPESGGNPRNHNPNAATGDDSYGLFQINMLGPLGPQRIAKYGLNPNTWQEDLYDPETNARIALRMHRESGNYLDWTTYKDGKFRPYLAQPGALASKPLPQGAAPSALAPSPLPQGAAPSALAPSPLPNVGGGLGAHGPGVGYNALGHSVPLGGGGNVRGGAGDKTVSSNITNQITVMAGDPQTAAAAVGVHLDRTAADVYRNLQGSIA